MSILTDDTIRLLGYPYLYLAAIVILSLLAYLVIVRKNRLDIWFCSLIFLYYGLLFVGRQDYLHTFSKDSLTGAWGSIYTICGSRFTLEPLFLMIVVITHNIGQRFDRTAVKEKRSKLISCVCLVILLLFFINSTFHYEITPFVDLKYKSYVVEYSKDGIGTMAVPLNPYPYCLIIPTSVQQTRLSNYSEVVSPNPVYAGYTTINHDSRFTCLANPGDLEDSVIEYDNITVPESAVLTFSIAMTPEVWAPEKGDGSGFSVNVSADGVEKRVFYRYIDPKHNNSDRKWIDNSVNLSEYANKNVTIKLIADAGPNNNSAFDWALWTQPVMTGKISDVS